MNRRDFFRQTSRDALRTAAQAIEETSRRSEAVTPSSSLRRVQTPGSPRLYKPGQVVLVTEARAYLGCDQLGFYAVDALCPHLGCRLDYEYGGFACPCHASRFSARGVLLYGPAPRNLRFFEVDLDAQGDLIIRRDREVPPNDRFVA
jgi:Rieske Fe-S protein